MITTYRVNESGCWVWTGKQHKGYGMHSGGALAHRVMYEREVGAIPAGLELDHLCRVPLCVNPAHLEPVTRQENIRRHWADYDTCVNGHAYTADNTYRRPTGQRDCRACIRQRVRAYQARRRAA